MRYALPTLMLKQLIRLIFPARRRLQPVPVRITALVGVLLIAGSAHAQEVQQITFDEAVRIALDQNITLQRTSNSVDLQEVNVSRDRMAFYPSLGISGGGSQSYGRTFSQEDLGFVSETTESFNMDIGADYTLFSGFSRTAALEQSRLGLEARGLDHQRQRQTVVFNVMSNYLTLIERQEQVLIQEENLESASQLLAQIEEFTRVGSRPISDLFQQQAQVAAAELALLQAQREVQLSEANLIQILQLDPFAEYEFSAPTVEDDDLVVQDYMVSSMLERAFAQRRDLHALEYDIRAAQEGIRLARSSYWPTVSLSAGYGSGWYSAYQRPGEPNVSFIDQLNDRRSGALRLNLSFPIFDRFETRNNIQSARVQLENVRLDLEGLQQDVAVQVRQAYLDYETAQKQLQVTEAQLASAELALEAEQERYNVGSSTLVELSQVRADYVRAAGDRVSARYGLLFQQRLIEYYLGILDPAQPLFDE